MDEPLKPPSQQPRRYFDIVPSKHAFPPATSRPIVTNQAANLADPMVLTAANNTPNQDNQTSPDPKLEKLADDTPAVEPREEIMQKPLEDNTDSDHSSQSMMEQEYQEVEHELPSGQIMADDQLSPSIQSANSDAGSIPAIVAEHPTHTRHTRRKEYAWVILSIALIIVIADLLLDSGIWHSGHHLPHTNFWH